jgi:hypothetical protein
MHARQGPHAAPPLERRWACLSCPVSSAGPCSLQAQLLVCLVGIADKWVGSVQLGPQIEWLAEDFGESKQGNVTWQVCAVLCCTGSSGGRETANEWLALARPPLLCWQNSTLLN